ncbi:MAG TPA: hypothetical protein VHP36_04515 [Chitinispirillaceae bacterium]|nr:hypothetical protein [Chitinispirillaceae bacterium]
MKKLTVTIAIIVIAFSWTYGQEKTFGIKGGFTISNFWGDGSENLNNTLRGVAPNLDEQNQYWFAVSIFNTRDLLPDFLSVQTEILYLRGGKSWEGNIGGTHFSTNVYADYFQMPWLAKITIPVLFRPRVYFGPYLSWMFRARLINAPIDFTTAITGETAPIGELFERYTNTVDLGLSTGVDFDIPFGPGNLVFDFRYNLGALNVFNVQAAAGLRNYIFLFMAGYSIYFGGY